LQTELFPFSFAEFLKFKNIKLDKHSFYSTTVCTSLRNAFIEYLQNGGIPEYLQTQNPYYLKSLYENIIYRDVITRYNLRNAKLLIEFIHFLISNTAKETSYNSLKNVFGIANANTVKEYISYFENSYLLFSINKFDYSLKKQIANPKKIYAIDTGLANSVSFRFSENYGRQIENVVFLHLRRKIANIFYHKNKTECDFVVVENKNIISAIQVTQSLDDPSVREREINGLMDAMVTYKLKEGLIITEDEEDSVKTGGQTIKILPVWKWLLGYEG
jgi:predicted AAA+ superfamily ATPase